MATTKKPTEATETAEQVQADNSKAEAVKAENEAAEKLTAPVYTAEEYARAAAKETALRRAVSKSGRNINY